MSNLKDLVPSVELCKLIPSGEFVESALMWIEVEIPQENEKEWRIVNRTRPIEFCHNLKYPAPTLQEILLEIEKAGGWCPTAYRLNVYWTVDCQDDKEDIMNDVMEQTDPDNPATAALHLWLKLKGIKYE